MNTKVVPLAIAFIMVHATALVQAVVNYLIMPILTPFIPGGAWQTATEACMEDCYKLGALLGAIINFVVIAWVVFLIAKYVFKEQKVSKK